MEKFKWHPAFFEAIQCELMKYKDVLEFVTEHQLTKEPLRIDVVIIKKKTDVVIEKNIGRIFKTINIVEYKSPDDYASVDDYSKVHGYAWIYASLNKVSVADLTLTFIVRHYPQALFAGLPKGHRIEKQQDGIYYITGSQFPVQVIVEQELSIDTNLWLVCLRREMLARQELHKLAKSIAEIGKDGRIGAYADILTQINEPVILEENMPVAFMVKAREEGIAIGEARGITIGEARGVSKGRAEGITIGEIEVKRKTALAMKAKGYPVADIADITGLTEDEIEKL